MRSPATLEKHQCNKNDVHTRNHECLAPRSSVRMQTKSPWTTYPKHKLWMHRPHAQCLYTFIPCSRAFTLIKLTLFDTNIKQLYAQVATSYKQLHHYFQELNVNTNCMRVTKNTLHRTFPRQHFKTNQIKFAPIDFKTGNIVCGHPMELKITKNQSSDIRHNI